MKHKKSLTKEEMDEIIFAKADDMTKWEKPITVKPAIVIII